MIINCSGSGARAKVIDLRNKWRRSYKNIVEALLSRAAALQGHTDNNGVSVFWEHIVRNLMVLTESLPPKRKTSRVEGRGFRKLQEKKQA